MKKNKANHQKLAVCLHPPQTNPNNKGLMRKLILLCAVLGAYNNMSSGRYPVRSRISETLQGYFSSFSAVAFSIALRTFFKVSPR